MLMKPIKQWIEQLPEPYRGLVIQYANKHERNNWLKNVDVENFYAAFDKAFWWDETEEKHTFWCKVFYNIRHEDRLPSIPTHTPLFPTLPDGKHPAPSEETKPTPQPHIMDYGNTPVARPTLVFGEDVATMSEARCLQLIKSNQDAAKALSDLGVESRTIETRIAEYAAVNTELVKRLDTFAPATPAVA